MAIKTKTETSFDGEFSVVIKHKTSKGYDLIEPVVEDGVKWETDRQGSPGKLTFKIYQDKNGVLEFQEGDAVALKYRLDSSEDWVALFTGYVFTKKRNKNGWIDVTAYDQLRYLKNKATYVYTNKTASEVLEMIIKDYKLTAGTIDNTTYVIGERVEDDQSLLDIVQNALDQTLISTTEMYVLYADSTGVCLRDINDMKLDLIIDDSVAKDFEYTSTIDDETYNEIELYYDNDETNKREYYHAFDSENMSNWGRLRLTENIKNPTNAEERVKKMLEVYNRKQRKLKVTEAFGDYRCRAGTSVLVNLDLGDIQVSNYMLVETAIHTFKKNEYRMDLTLGGTTEFV